MPDLAALTRDDHLIPAAVEAAAASGDDLATAIGSAADDITRAAVAIAAGLRVDRSAVDALLAVADDDTVAARAAGWALGRCADEARLVAAATEGGLDLREQAYRALAGLAARGAASPNLAEALRARIDAELARAAKGLTSLAEHVTRVLAVLGAEDTSACIRRVIETDSLADRFELDRQRKQVEAEGRDLETIKELTGDWTEIFADLVLPEDSGAEVEVEVQADAPLRAPSPPAPRAAAPPAPGGLAEMEPDEEEEALSEEEAAAEAVDWEAFAASPECIALGPDQQQLATQFGPMLEQLVTQVARLPLTAITGQELAGLLLQVLPQAAPPQVVNAALSPQGLNAFQAVTRYLARTGSAVHGEDLVAGIKLVRQTMREQIRASGMLGGPDYSDPDEPATPGAAG